MMKIKRLVLLAACAACLANLAELKQSATAADDKPPSTAPPANAEDQTALELGHKVLAVRHAIEHPQAPESLEAVKALGLDSRYYVMVRGWLGEQLRADSSIRDAGKGNTPQNIKDRIAFLEKAIRAIDLE